MYLRNVIELLRCGHVSFVNFCLGLNGKVGKVLLCLKLILYLIFKEHIIFFSLFNILSNLCCFYVEMMLKPNLLHFCYRI